LIAELDQLQIFCSITITIIITFIHWCSQRFGWERPKWKIFVTLFWWRFSVT